VIPSPRKPQEDDMTFFAGPEEHAANSPSTWKVVKVAERQWAVQTADGTTIETCTTKKAATEATTGGYWFNQYEKETRWYAGEPVAQWKPWAQVRAERERNERWQQERRAAKAQEG
jgi:hypothetical protein